MSCVVVAGQLGGLCVDGGFAIPLLTCGLSVALHFAQLIPGDETVIGQRQWIQLETGTRYN